MQLNRTIAPAIQLPESFSLLEARKIELDNAVPLYYINAGTEDVLRLDVIFDAGSWRQDKKCQASAVNHLLQEGTSHFTARQLADQLDYYGAFMQNSCSVDEASLTLYVLNKHLEKCLPLLFEIISNASFPEQELEIYKNNSKQNLAVNQKKTSYLARVRFHEEIWGAEHPYGRHAGFNDYDSLQRSDLLRFKEKHYSAQNARLLVSGKVNENSLAQIAAVLGADSWRSGSWQAEKLAQFPEKSIPAKRVQVSKEDAMQSSIRIGKKLFNRSHPHYRKLQLLNLVLGGFFGSRLMKNIREEKGLTYGIYSSLESNQHGGTFYVATDVNNELSELAIEEIMKEMKRLREEPISAEELNTARSYLLGSFMRSIDGPFALADRFKILLDYNLDYSYYKEFIHTIKTIGAAELQQLAQEHLAEEDFSIVVAGKSSSSSN